VETKPIIMSIAESITGDLRLYIDSPTGIRFYDFHNSTIEDVVAPGIPSDQMGPPINNVLMSSSVVACYTSIFQLMN
jgi:hypothetical protein